MKGFILLLEQDMSLNEAGSMVFFASLVVLGMIAFYFCIRYGKTNAQLLLTKQLEFEKKKLAVLVSQLGGYVFIYRPKKDELTLYENQDNQLVEKNVLKSFKMTLGEQGSDYLEDTAGLLGILEQAGSRPEVEEMFLLKSLSDKKEKLGLYVFARAIWNEAQKEDIYFGYAQEKSIADEKAEVFQKEIKDAVTGLNNEAGFKMMLKDKISEKLNGVRYAVLLIRVLNYEQYCVSYSEDIPEKVDKRVAKCMTTMFREEDILGRISNDEYMVCMGHITSRDDLRKKAEDFCVQLNKVTRESEGGKIEVTIGVALFPMDGEDYDTLYHKAETALKSGMKEKENVIFYDISLEAES